MSYTVPAGDTLTIGPLPRSAAQPSLEMVLIVTFASTTKVCRDWMATLSGDLIDLHRTLRKDRLGSWSPEDVHAAVLAAVATTMLCAIAFFDDASTDALPVVLVLVSYAMLAMKATPPVVFPRITWCRLCYLFLLVSIVYFSSVEQAFTEHFELAVYAGCGPLLLALYTATPLRPWEVAASQAVVVAALWWASGSWRSVLLEVALAVSASVLWYLNPMLFRKVRVFELYVHDLRGFLASLRWTLSSPTDELLTSAGVEMERRLAGLAQLDELMSIPRWSRRKSRFDATPKIAGVLGVDVGSPLVIHASADKFAAVLHLLGFLTSEGSSVEVRDTGHTVRVVLTPSGPDWVVENAFAAASRMQELPHRLEIGESIHLSLRRSRRGV